MRQEAFPLSGDAGIGDIRDMIASGTHPARRPPRRGTLTSRDVLDDYVEHTSCRSSTRRSSSRSTSVLDAGSGMGGLVAPKLFERLPCRTTRAVLRRSTARFPNHEANPLIEENRRDIVERVVAEQGRHRHRVGRRRRPLLLHRRRRRVHRGRLRHGAARRGVPAEASGREGRLRPARELRGQGHGGEVRRAAR